jgi:class 3 adenylate cyclase/pimeloyl-ACP methyl ester carboxylesterase
MPYRDTLYARPTDGAYIAYQIDGEGPPDIAVAGFDWGNLDILWDGPSIGVVLNGLASLGRVIVHDRRGIGLSSRNVHVPNLETRVSDLTAVLDAVGSERAIIYGAGESGSAGVMFAATHPERVRALIWNGPMPRLVWAPDYPWGVRPEYVERERAATEAWGTRDYGKLLQETEAAAGHVVPDDRLERFALLTRQMTTPDVARELMDIWYETDVRPLLSAVQVPTLLITGSGRVAEEAAYVASQMPNATLFQHPSEGLLEDPDLIRGFLVEIGRFIGVEKRPSSLDTVLSTVLFTDIIDSTQKQASLGDHGWKSLIERHHGIVRETLARWRGAENDTAGDGFYATFDGPARAISAALDITERVRPLGIEVRAGVHTGECEVVEGKCAGLTVSIGSRVAGAAGPSQVFISQTVKDLVAGSGFTFVDAGDRELKGVPGSWRLYEASGTGA